MKPDSCEKIKFFVVMYCKEKHFPYKQMFSSLNTYNKKVSFVEYGPNEHQKYIVSKIIHKITFGEKLQKKFKNFFQQIYKNKLKNLIIKHLHKLNINEKDEIIFIINQTFIFDVLESFKKEFPNIKVVYFFTDQIDKCNIRTDIWENPKKYYADLIISYDEDDAKKHNVLYYSNPYSEIKDKEILSSCKNVKYDVCFIGAMKDRHEEIILAYDHLVSMGLKVLFYVTYEKHNNFNKHKGIIYSYRSTTYKKYLKLSAQSRCILDITQGNSKAYTTRIAESVMLGKKLITNNINVKNLPFYNENKIYVYKDLLDVDDVFFKKNTNDLYDTEAKEYFNPNKFIEFIDKNL